MLDISSILLVLVVLFSTIAVMAFTLAINPDRFKPKDD